MSLPGPTEDRAGASQARGLSGRSVAVFGSSEPEAGSPAYEEAQRVGELLARGGARVISGGYGGVMEGASRGARDAGGTAIGVTGSFFGGRPHNTWLTEVILTDDLFERTRVLINLSDAFIILPGKSGTIAELAFLWALHRAGSLGARPVVLCGAIWPDLIAALGRAGALEPAQLAVTDICSNAEQAVHRVAELLGPLA